MKIPIKYSIRNFKERKLTTGVTVFGVGLVVFVFAAVLMMAYGIQKTLIATGTIDNVKVLRKSSNGEISSIIPSDIQDVISTLPHIKKNSEGRPIISYEPVVIINLNIIGGGVSNITVRGVSPEVSELRPHVKIIKGRMFNYGSRELIVGPGIVKKFEGAKVGDQIKFAGDEWSIVGEFEAEGSGFESEIWGDAKQLLDAFNRGNTVSTITLKLDNAADFGKFKAAFESDRRLEQFEPKVEQTYYEEESEMMSNFIRIMGIFITVIFSLGATIGAMITMYAAVANRTVEIGTLRSLGFKRRSVLAAFLIESVLLSIIGAVVGLFFASFLQFFSVSTLNWSSFAELKFDFAISPSIIISSLLFAVFMGFVGGFLPAIRASRMKIVVALKSV